MTARPGTTPVSVEQLDCRSKLLTDTCAVEACTRAACWCPWTFTHPGGTCRSGTCVNSNGGSPCAYSDAHTSSWDVDANERFYGSRFETRRIVFEDAGGTREPVGLWRQTLARYAN